MVVTLVGVHLVMKVLSHSSYVVLAWSTTEFHKTDWYSCLWISTSCRKQQLNVLGFKSTKSNSPL